MIVLLTSPLFFSGIVFSTLLKGVDNIANAMSYNLMGAMMGGLLEYNSMQYGFAFLYLIALMLYGLALVTSMRVAAVQIRA
jgi:phosphoglycerol transferase MdoB-like AlkP superfamily enzyme